MCVRHEDKLEIVRNFQIAKGNKCTLKKRVRALFFNGREQVRSAAKRALTPFSQTSFPGGNSEWEPPDPFSNSEVKTLSADGSVGSPHVRVGHRQDFISNEASFLLE